MTSKPLRIELLGAFRVQVGDDIIPAEAWRRRKVRHLIEVLALSHGHRLRREQLMDMLWPDADPQSALNSLHQTLYLARNILNSSGTPSTGYLLLQDEIVSLAGAPFVSVDVAAQHSSHAW